MTLPHLSARTPALAAAAASLLALSGAAQAPVDPFTAGVRWTYAADPLAPWIPRDVAFAAEDELVLAAPAVQTARVHLFASSALVDPAAPLAEDATPDGALGPVLVASGDGADELYSLHQLASPSSTSRATLLSRLDAGTAGAGFAPRWTSSVGPSVSGPALLAVSADGGCVVAAAFAAASGLVHVEWFDPATGAVTASVALAGNALRALTLSTDGDRLVLAAGTEIWVLDGAGSVLRRESLGVSTGAVAVSPDGQLVTIGDFGALRAVDPLVPAVDVLTVTASASELPVQARFSADGSTLAVTWWDVTTGVDVRCDVVDVPTGLVVGSYSQSGVFGSYQNYPADLALSDDGERVALGLWGYADGQPEVVLLDRAGGEVLSADLPGSVYALDVSADGTRVAVASKSAHANLFSTTGSVRLLDTGERPLQLLGAARPGGSLDAAHLVPGSLATVFGLGSPSGAPVPLPGASGALRIDLAAPHAFVPALPDATGRADLKVPLRADPALIGYPLAVQGAALTPAGVVLSDALVHPPVL